MFQVFKKITKSLRGKNLGKIPGVRPLHRFLFEKLKPKGAALLEIQGSKMFINPEDTGEAPDLLLRGVYDEYETELVKNLIKPGMRAVDIGAHIGYFTLIMARAAGPEGKVWAFEPEPENFKLLKTNIKINNLDNVTAYPYALSNKKGKVKLFLDKKNLGNVSLQAGNISAQDLGGSFEVEAHTLDEHFEKEKIDFIKIDVQGAEGLVLKGGEKTLKNNKLKMIMEFWPWGLKNLGSDPLEFLIWLQGLGFRFSLLDARQKILKPKDPASLLSVSENREGGKGWANLLCEN
ncbi:hypothetical protein A2757_00560 [Candidatus Giovannonibacteria bacterium RIFCSPHIGHO2_01_FULL_48_47]|nr:MAG: hypothetical protein A2757_00560 [Candidatus Giovannonibacteria bacterium RIFCSPHIGHO2_01_FULL_48_47]OGF68358.1 MAG: hypothetical protein A3D61_00550 [Candidatus Giovannonibacteria bacterium RIFCSPHIGHO2_02_FULL_48_15]OGF89978.1 MAG: hypothetical protein A3B26_01070 [Candidatus Giovannonibacteria bacterium RIFCSPLOWO2_01_FULL_48_47]OGF95533.1 MAG: hypothetical protein A2433_02270 [Candidatus Giovannonibacteria bacterium RIFOXYC1_FULL_48_8]OGF96187.1 MAG: hypothetical protein A2613_01300